MTYYSCNKDSIWVSRLVIVLTVFTILIMKVVIVGELYEKNNTCYPPAFFFGNVSSARHPFYLMTRKDGFENREKMVSLGKEHLSNLNNGIVDSSDNIYNYVINFVQEQTKFDLRFLKKVKK